jgi:hypothetical protein
MEAKRSTVEMGFLSLIAKLGLDTSGFESGLKRSEGMAQQSGNTMGNALRSKIGSALGSTAIVGVALHRIAKQFEDTKELATRAKEIGHGAERLGIDKQDFQDREFALQRTGVQGDALFTVYRKLAVASQDARKGNKDLKEEFRELGISMADVGQLNVDQLFMKIAQNMTGAELTAGKLAAAVQTMGRAADEILPAMRAGFFGEKNPFKLSSEELQGLTLFKKDLGIIEKTLKSIYNHGLAKSAIIAGAAIAPFRKLISGKRGGPKDEPQGLDTTLADIEAEREAEAQREINRKKELDFKKRFEDALERQKKLNLQILRDTSTDAVWEKILQQRMARLKAQKFDLSTPQGLAENQERNNAVAETSLELISLRNKKDRVPNMQVDPLARIGGFGGNADVALRMITSQERIVKATEQTAINTGWKVDDGTGL